jgi:hypothetical protein
MALWALCVARKNMTNSSEKVIGIADLPLNLLHFSEVLIAVNLVLSAVPMPLTEVMIAMARPAAIRPYSMAVALSHQQEMLGAFSSSHRRSEPLNFT